MACLAPTASVVQRGETRVGRHHIRTADDAQRIDIMEGESSKRSYCTTAFRPSALVKLGLRGPGRRDWHGALPTAILPIIPAEDKFPYTIQWSPISWNQWIVLHSVGFAAEFYL